MTTLRIRVGRCIQEERLRQGLTQAGLAERADLSLKYLGEIERGEANVTVDALERLATALAWDASMFLAFDGHRISKSLHALLRLELGAIRDRLVATLVLLEAVPPGGDLAANTFMPRQAMSDAVTPTGVTRSREAASAAPRGRESAMNPVDARAFSSRAPGAEDRR